jgi:hypothetical protein
MSARERSTALQYTGRKRCVKNSALPLSANGEATVKPSY